MTVRGALVIICSVLTVLGLLCRWALAGRHPRISVAAATVSALGFIGLGVLLQTAQAHNTSPDTGDKDISRDILIAIAFGLVLSVIVFVRHGPDREDALVIGAAFAFDLPGLIVSACGGRDFNVVLTQCLTILPLLVVFYYRSLTPKPSTVDIPAAPAQHQPGPLPLLTAAVLGLLILRALTMRRPCAPQQLDLHHPDVVTGPR